MEPTDVHLLIVDDNEINCELLARRLGRRGFVTSIARSGSEALRLLDEEPFDLVLLDVNMPGMDGLQVLKVIRDTYPLTALPVLMTTALNDNEMLVQALSLGANDYLSKPVDFAILLARIETQLRLSQLSNDPELSTGEYQRLRGRHRPLAYAAGYCARCTMCQPADSESCAECGTPMPDDGWPDVRVSSFVHLGTSVKNRYFLERFIGSGATGSVYRARDVDLNRKFAIKIVDFGADAAGSLRRRLESEVDAMAALTNPHVVRIYEVAKISDAEVGLVMDFVKGHTLGSVLDRVGQLEPWLALDIVRQAAQGLHEAHQAGLVHRDVKPDNIMLEKLPAGGYHTKILDFGIARNVSARQTLEGFLGTPLYMSPEHVADDVPMDHRADIYSLGAVLYHMLAGVPPYVASSVVGILNKHLAAPIPTFDEVLEGHAQLGPLNDLLAGMLAKTPESRFDSLFDVIRRIDAILPALSTEDDRTSNSLPEGVQPPAEGASHRITLEVEKPRGVRQMFRTLSWTHDDRVEVALSSDFQLMCARVGSGVCKVVHLDFPGSRARRTEVPFDAPHAVCAITPDGRFGAVVGRQVARGSLLNMETGMVERPLSFPTHDIGAIAISADGELVAVGDRVGGLYIQEGQGSAMRLALDGPPITCLAFSQRRSELAIGRMDKTLQVTPIDRRGLRSQLPPLPFVPRAAAFNGVGDLGAVLSEDKHISLFLPMGGAIVNQQEFTFDSVLTIAFDRRSRLICLESTEGALRLWDIQRLFDTDTGRTTIIRSER